MPVALKSLDFSNHPTITVRARAIIDATGTNLNHGAITLAAELNKDGTIATLRTQTLTPDVNNHELPTLHLPHSVILPALVNAHCHLDLTNIGPQKKPTSGGFPAWLDLIRRNRPQTDTDIQSAVRKGIELSHAGGVVAVGDIAGCINTGPSLTPWRTLQMSSLGGTSFLEFFAIGSMERPAIDRLRNILDTVGPNATKLGLSPHAPYSISPTAYQAALELAKQHNLPLTTHLAETRDERDFIAYASGPQRDFIESLGLWNDTIDGALGKGHHPVAHLAFCLSQYPWLLAHINDCTDEALDILAHTNASIAYCPRASEYFNAPDTLGPHRYRDMLARGINVCLGTDSIVNLPEAATSTKTGGITPLDDARLLYQRDRTDPNTLLAMLTTNGARALGLDPVAFTFARGTPLAGIIAVDIDDRCNDPLTGVFTSTASTRLLASVAMTCKERGCLRAGGIAFWNQSKIR